MEKLSLALLGVLVSSAALAAHFEQRNEVSYLRGKYNTALFYRHNETFRNGAAIHFAHGIQHDYLQLKPITDPAALDERMNNEYVDFLLNHRAKTEPTMEYYGPYVARGAWKLYRAIDWTHMHHEQTYDVMSERSIPWAQKKEWTDRTVRYYLAKNPGVARSGAPLDVTMRRAGTMMKPYFTLFRNQYPKSNNFFLAIVFWTAFRAGKRLCNADSHELFSRICQWSVRAWGDSGVWPDQRCRRRPESRAKRTATIP